MRVSVSLGVLVMALTVGEAGAWISKTVRDWQVSCSNGLTCSLTYGDDASEGLRSVSFERTSAPQAGISIEIFDAAFLDAEPTSGQYEISVDGETILTLDMATAEVEYGSVRFADVDDADRLLEAMKSGRSMSVSTDEDTLSVPLSGVTAGLLYMDEVQDRLGRTDALQSKGDTAPPERPRVEEFVAIEDLPAEIRDDFSDIMAPCGGSEPEAFRRQGAFRVNVDDELSFLAVPCGMGGAYNQPFVFYGGFDGELKSIAVPTMTIDGPSTTDFAYNIDYSGSGDEIVSLFKGRGIGDCGSLDTFRFSASMVGVALILTESRMKGECDGDFGDGPDGWERVWPR
jgi:hypothetical protein